MLMLVVAATDRGGELEIEAAAAHGAVDHGPLERLELGQVLVDEIGDLDKGLRASLACRCASNVCACAQIRLAEARSSPGPFLAGPGGRRSLVPRPLQAALPPPSSFHLQRHSRATFSNCILPLATG